MEEKSIIYGTTNLGLLFVPESRAKELADSNKKSVFKNYSNMRSVKLLGDTKIPANCFERC